MKIQRLDDLALFLTTVDAGSFSAAARQLDVAPAVASAAIKRLEAQLGVRLFERTTRRLRLSEAGERFLPDARQAWQHLRDAEQALDADAHALTGTLRLTLPSNLARSHLLDWLEDYLAERPAVRLEMQVSDRVADLYQQPIDLAVRYGQPEDSRFIALPLAPDNRRVLVASPDYLARHGKPGSLSELQQHACLLYRLGDAVHDRWRFDLPGEPQIKVRGTRISDDGDVVRLWALRGLGVAYKSYLDVSRELTSGELVQLLPELPGELAPVHLLLIHRQRLNPALRELAQAMARFCQQL